MNLYHGTCTAFEPSIKQLGLIPKPENKYKVAHDPTVYDPIELPAVYLTTSKTVAREFAQFRADWMRAQAGDVVFFNGVNGKKKLGGPIIPDCKPLLVTVVRPVPLHRDPNLQNDPDPLFWTDAAIPIDAIRLTVLPDKPKSLIFGTLESVGVKRQGFSTLAEYQQAYRETL